MSIEENNDSIAYLVETLKRVPQKYDHRAISEFLIIEALKQHPLYRSGLTLEEFALSVGAAAGWIFEYQGSNGDFIFKRK